MTDDRVGESGAEVEDQAPAGEVERLAERILRGLGLDVRASVRDDQETIQVDLAGPHFGDGLRGALGRLYAEAAAAKRGPQPFTASSIGIDEEEPDASFRLHIAVEADRRHLVVSLP